ncbi:MAG: MYXO-CTERM sorting domain-containing protein [Myxococcota bacterium]
MAFRFNTVGLRDSNVAEVEGEAKSGCAAAGATGGLAALAIGLLMLIRRRR